MSKQREREVGKIKKTGRNMTLQWYPFAKVQIILMSVQPSIVYVLETLRELNTSYYVYFALSI